MLENPTTTVNNDIIDLDLGALQKKKFRFGHDDSRILELNISDMGILGRVGEAYPKLTALQDRASTLMEGMPTDENDNLEVTMAGIKQVGDKLKDIDKEMRDLIDFIFNANVSEVTAPDGSMYDPFNGSFRFEIIITALMGQYEQNLSSEFNKMEKQLKKHTSKYVGK